MTVPPATLTDTLAHPEIARLARASRREMRKRLPTAIELVYDNYNALAIGFSSTARASDCIVSLAVYPRGVNLYFMYGAALPDPSGVLLGKGNRGRFVRLASAGDFDKKEIATLLREATGLADPPLPPNGRGRKSDQAHRHLSCSSRSSSRSGLRLAIGACA